MKKKFILFWLIFLLTISPVLLGCKSKTQLDSSVYQHLVLEKVDNVGFERILDLTQNNTSNKVKLNWKLSFQDTGWQDWISTENGVWILDTERKLFYVDSATGKIEYNHTFKDLHSLLLFEGDILYLIAKQQDGIYSVQAYQPNNKKMLWTKSLEDDNSLLYGRIIINDTLYIGTYSGPLLTLRVKDGSELWRLETMQKARSDFFFHENLLFFTTADSICYAVDKDTGKVVWKRQGVFLQKSTFPPEFNLLTAMNGILGYFGNIYEPFVMMDIKTGNLLWEYPYSSDLVQSFKNNASDGIDSNIMSSKPTKSFINLFEKPFSIGNKIVLLFTIGHKKNLHVIDPLSKKIIWQKNDVEFCYQTADNKILIGRDELKDDLYMYFLEKLNPETGEVIWQNDTFTKISKQDDFNIHQSQIIDHYFLTLEHRGNMLLIDTNTGNLVWSYSSNEGLENDYANPTIQNNVFIVEQHSPHALLCFSLVK